MAPFGVVGLETAVSLCLDRLVHQGVIPLSRLVALFTTGPAGVLHLKKGTLAVGADADVTIIDPDHRWTVDATRFRSKSRNTPFAGWELRGRADTVIVGGKVKYRLGA
jgi:dihydroorotase